MQLVPIFVNIIQVKHQTLVFANVAQISNTPNASFCQYYLG